MDQIAERVALNEALFRDVNKNIAKVSSHGRHENAHFICECGETSCEERIVLTAAEYHAVRADELRFFVKPGHEIPHTERVVERFERYLVVEKPPEARPLLEG